LFAFAVFACSFVLGVVVLLALRGALEHEALMRTNYAGRRVPTAAGIVFVPVYLAIFALLLLFFNTGIVAQSFAYGLSFLIALTGMCFLGFLDDVLIGGEARGFVGHFRELFKGRLTTGVLKAVGGFLVGVSATFQFSHHTWEILLNAAIVALLANLFNLLDLRPGRAIKVFLPVLVGVAALNWRYVNLSVPYMLGIGAVALVLLPGDLSEKFMLGDAGSNVLGVTAGLGVVIAAGNWWKLGVLVGLMLFNLISERVSFSDVIASNRALNWLDSLGRQG
jgi:UDP-N-acetylmuramyl pentapeptide phosphotransferase/UDP-N-acetylglucosamine-1-phosphate transferase